MFGLKCNNNSLTKKWEKTNMVLWPQKVRPPLGEFLDPTGSPRQ